MQTNDIKKRGRKPKNELINNIINNKFIKSNSDLDIKYSEKLDLCDEFNLILDNNEQISSSNNIWLDKYKPINSINIIGNKEHIIILKKWLNNFSTNKYSAAIISGKHGIGKKLIINLILEEMNYNIKYIHSSYLKSKTSINEIINNYSKTKNIFNILNNDNNKKYAIIICDSENITLNSEKDKIIELFKLNSINKYFPIIFLCNMQHSKLVNNLKKISLDIQLLPPTILEIKNFIIHICKNENIIFMDDNIYTLIINFCQSDIRRLISILQDLYNTYYKIPIKLGMFKEYLVYSQKKNIDIGLYSATNILLNNYKSIDICMQLYESEKVLLPLTIYENYYKKIFNNNLTNKQILESMITITKSISDGDIIETNIYTDQNWYLQNIHGFFTCVNSCYILNRYNNTYNKDLYNYNIEFSVDLNKTSSKNINKKKNILNIQNKFKNKNLLDIIYINKILYELEISNNTIILDIIKKNYDLNSKNIVMALKIDKTNKITINKKS